MFFISQNDYIWVDTFNKETISERIISNDTIFHIPVRDAKIMYDFRKKINKDCWIIGLPVSIPDIEMNSQIISINEYPLIFFPTMSSSTTKVEIKMLI